MSPQTYTSEDLKDTLCDTCLRKVRCSVNKTYTCTALRDFYFNFGWESCFAFCADRRKIIHELGEMIEHLKDHDHVNQHALTHRFRVERDHHKSLLDRELSKEAREVFLEEQRKGRLGGGEKSDRTHKLFSRERMKDNRLKLPWEGF